jgi:tetratricopeptide (TPR) repeat protein
VQRANAARRLGDRPRALELGLEAVALGGESGDVSFDAHYNVACELRALGVAEPGQVAEAFAQAARVAAAQGEAGGLVDEKRGACEFNLGKALREAGDREQAGLALERALDFLPDAADVWAELGLVMAEMGQAEAALVCQRQMIRCQAAAAAAAAGEGEEAGAAR